MEKKKNGSREDCVYVCVCVYTYKIFIYLAALGFSTFGIWALSLWCMGYLDLIVNSKKRMSSTAPSRIH